MSSIDITDFPLELPLVTSPSATTLHHPRVLTLLPHVGDPLVILDTVQQMVYTFTDSSELMMRYSIQIRVWQRSHCGEVPLTGRRRSPKLIVVLCETFNNAETSPQARYGISGLRNPAK